MRPGDVGYLYLTRVGYHKFIICVEPSCKYFLFISTDPPISTETAVEVDPREIHCLDYRSYIDTSHLKIVYHAADDVTGDPSIIRENIRAGVRNKIKASVENHDVMAGWEKRMVLDNL